MKYKFKKFWVVSVNNWICDAHYDGKTLKEKHITPSFRKFHFIRSWDDIKYFSTRKNRPDNKILCQELLENN